MLSCVYLYLSALQLQRGMPLVVRDRPLTDSNDKLKYVIFKGFLLMPFLWEFKAALDWTVDKTSLDFFSYMKLEDIYAGLCVSRHELNYRREHRRGAQRTWQDTCLFGFGTVLGLMLVLLGPLLLFSSASPLAGNNNLIGAQAHPRWPKP